MPYTIWITATAALLLGGLIYRRIRCKHISNIDTTMIDPILDERDSLHNDSVGGKDDEWRNNFICIRYSDGSTCAGFVVNGEFVGVSKKPKT
ncbi:hypothetical protein [Venatoribacter cucullus]|uniref:hypothetical protein n=1 Tax=Venatoribacter cucullus TaxID=2661630 RepID=UPI0022401D02|nr:hypothetical protein [Venatoribacter cucullus]UZK04728.1 hypothetical protein GAY96_12815 [Venatoribacter cucullus]